MVIVDKVYHRLKGLKQLSEKSSQADFSEEEIGWNFTINDGSGITYFENDSGDVMEPSVASYRFYINGNRVEPKEFVKKYSFIYEKRSFKDGRI